MVVNLFLHEKGKNPSIFPEGDIYSILNAEDIFNKQVLILVTCKQMFSIYSRNGCIQGLNRWKSFT